MTVNLEDKITLKGRIREVHRVDNGDIVMIHTYFDALTATGMSDSKLQQEGLVWIGRETLIGFSRKRARFQDGARIEKGENITLIKPPGDIKYGLYKETLSQDKGEIKIIYGSAYVE